MENKDSNEEERRRVKFCNVEAKEYTYVKCSEDAKARMDWYKAVLTEDPEVIDAVWEPQRREETDEAVTYQIRDQSTIKMDSPGESILKRPKYLSGPVPIDQQRLREAELFELFYSHVTSDTLADAISHLEEDEFRYYVGCMSLAPMTCQTMVTHPKAKNTKVMQRFLRRARLDMVRKE